jgi:hypothetical protein
MKKAILFGLLVSGLVFLFNSTLIAQSSSIHRVFKGNVTDLELSKPIGDVTVSIYNAKDTSLINFSFTTKNGNFEFLLHTKDSLFLVFSAIGYQEQVLKLNAIQWDWDYDTDRKITMKRSSSSQLKEVTISASLIYMKGDTIEINAKRLRVLPNSDVSQLFKKIPGFDVDKKGNVKVNGSEVSKIIVDGSDFFGNNPNLVSKNLRADMIDKIQVFDDKDENGDVGIEHTKTINLKLKKNARNGSFGDVMAGYGTAKKYQSGLRMNNFKNDRKLSVISNSNNNNNEGFDFGFDNWHGGSEAGLIGSTKRYVRFDNPFDESSTTGNLNTNSNFAGTYFNEFSRKRKVSGTLSLSNNNFYSIGKSFSVNPVYNSILQNAQATNATNGNAKLLSGIINYSKTIDSVGSYGLGWNNQVNQSRNSATSTNAIYENTNLINSGSNNSNANDNSQISNAYFNFNRRNRKIKNLSITANYNFKWTTTNSQQFQYSNLKLTTYNLSSSNQLLGKEHLINLNITVPIWKKFRGGIRSDLFILNYKNALDTKQASNLLSNDFNQSYLKEIDSLSIHYLNKATQQNNKLFFLWMNKEENSRFNFGVTRVQINLINSNYNGAATIQNQFSSFLPFIKFSNWKKSNRYIAFTIEKVVDFPKFSQLVPVQNLSNPWFRLIGNPNLKPIEQAHLYGSYSIRTEKFLKQIWTSLNVYQSNNFVVASTTRSSNGISYSQPINKAGYWLVDYNLYNRLMLSKTLSFNMQSNYNFNKIPQLLNEVNSFGISNQIDLSPGLEYEIDDQLDFTIDYHYNGTFYKNNVNTNTNYQQSIQGLELSLNASFKTRTALEASLSITDNRPIPEIGKLVSIFNCSIKQPLDKNEKWTLKLTCYDLFKQNVTLTRMVNAGVIQTTESNLLQRFFMLTLIYQLKSTQGQESGGFTE